MAEQAGFERDPFAVLSIPRLFHIEEEALKERFLRLSRAVHPDRFVRAPVHERAAAMRRSTALNDAYRVLADPVRRAEVLLADTGRDRERARTQDPALLMETIERREEVEELVANRQAGASGASEALHAALGHANERLRAAETQLDGLFAAWDARDAQSEAALVTEITAVVERYSYDKGIADELTRATGLAPSSRGEH